MDYQALRDKVMNENFWTDEELDSRIFIGQMWHNPMNFSSGADLKRKYGWDCLFTDFVKNRFYFGFHSHDLSDPDRVIKLFKSCKNWKKYVKIWGDYAPLSVSSEEMYLLVVTEMTARGIKHEKEYLDYEALSKAVRRSTVPEDLSGIDAWVDGEPIQIKSPKTTARIRGLL